MNKEGLFPNKDVLNKYLEFVESEYRVSDHIVQSGQRDVYRAVKNGSNGFILKLTPHDPTEVARIQREIKILSSLESNSFPNFHSSFFITQQSIGYFLENLHTNNEQEIVKKNYEKPMLPLMVTVEEYIEHIQWEDCAGHFRDQKNLADLLIAIFSSLDLIWAKEIVHRDLKFQNILIRPNFSPVIIDFGIAKSLRDETLAITEQDEVCPFTLQYAAPEQYHLQWKAEVKYKADQFSIGVMSFCLLTREFPFGDRKEIGGMKLMDNVLKNNIASLKDLRTDIHPELEKFILKLLAVKPFQRFRNSESILKILTSIKEQL